MQGAQLRPDARLSTNCPTIPSGPIGGPGLEFEGWAPTLASQFLYVCVLERERERENTHKMYHFTILAPAYSSAAVGSIHSIVQPSRLSVADPSPRLGRKPWPHKQSLLFPLPQHRTTQICFLSLWTCLFCISQKWNQTPWGVFPSLSMLLSGSSAQSPSAHGSCLSLVGSLHPWPPLPPGVTHLSSLG